VKDSDTVKSKANKLKRKTTIVPVLELNPKMPLVDELADLTMFIQRHLLISLGRQTSESKLSIPQYTLLSYLSYHEALNMGTLAKFMGHTTPATTGLVDRLSKAGLVERTTNDFDRRVVMVQITGEGRDLVNGMRRDIIRLLKDVAEKISPDDQKAWLRIYRTMHDFCAERRAADERELDE
jgi:DNA-binding MarR family transcriptional regulator